DPTRLAQVLVNLLENAGRHTSRGGRVLVRVSADPDRRQATVTVSDTGEGIASDLLPQLFEPFTQAEQGLERPRGGLGLGLSVVKRLVELHGGEVRAASAGPGRGAEFTIRLPTEPEPAALSGPPDAPRRPCLGLRLVV